MSDIFGPPEDQPVSRAKPPFCGHLGPDGEKCDLYRDHISEVHMNSHTHTRWHDGWGVHVHE